MLRKIALIVIVVILAASAFLYPKLQQLRIDVPEYQAPGKLVLLDQGWNQEQRKQFHHTSQGTRLVPYPWFLALEQPCLFSCEPFAKQEYLGRFGFLAGDPDPVLNPDRLPVGLARQVNFTDPGNGKTYAVLGLTCAACHTGELHYKDHAVRIEGGVAMIQPTAFQKALGTALILTDLLPWRYRKFESAVLGENATEQQRAELKEQVQSYVEKAKTELALVQTRNIYPNDAGFGRTDALTRIGNQVFGSDMGKPDNYVQSNAPVRFPQIWDASWFTWVQYNSSIADPLVRNIGEALGVRALARLDGPKALEFASSIDMEGLKKLEDLLSGASPYQGLRSPKWPAVFPPLEMAKVEEGARLYAQHCAGCHLPPSDKLQQDLSNESRYWVSNSVGKKYLKCSDVPIDLVGTDPNQARDFMNRTADSGDLGKGRVSAGEGLELVTTGIRDQYFAKMSFSPAQRAEWTGYRAEPGSAVRSKAIYKARPLNGIWSAAPYLHNGSVPSLYELIASRKQRGKPSFWLGTKRFDPRKVGYDQSELKGGSLFDYTLPGNSNQGHWFEDGPRGKGVIGPAFTDTQRWALVEYLKSL